MLEILTGLFTIGFNIIGFFFSVMIAFVAAFIALVKGRNPLFWGILVFIQPWIIFIILLIPRKIPRIKSYLTEVEGFKDHNIVASSVMALAAVVAKADGQVTKEELKVVKQFITTTFGMGRVEISRYEAAFNYGKEHPEEYKEFAKIIRVWYNRRDFILAVSYLLISIGYQNKEMSQKEDQIIQSIVGELGISEYEYINLKNYFQRMASGQSGSYGSYGRNGYGSSGYGRQGFNPNQSMNQETLIEKYTKVLQVPKDADMTTIKKAYRKLAKEYHPDKGIAEGMPEDYIKYATEQSAKLNEAYDYLKEVKG